MRQPYPNELMHHGVKDQKWGIKHGPPYPLYEQKGNSKAVLSSKKNFGDSDSSSGKDRNKLERVIKRSTRKANFKVNMYENRRGNPGIRRHRLPSGRTYTHVNKDTYIKYESIKDSRREEYEKLSNDVISKARKILDSGGTFKDAKEYISSGMDYVYKNYLENRKQDMKNKPWRG